MIKGACHISSCLVIFRGCQRRPRAPPSSIAIPYHFVQALGDITRQLCDGSGGGTVFFPGMEGCGGCGYCASLAARHHNQVSFHQNQSIPVQNMVKARYRRQAAAVGDGGGDGLDAVVDGHVEDFSCGSR